MGRKDREYNPDMKAALCRVPGLHTDLGSQQLELILFTTSGNKSENEIGLGPRCLTLTICSSTPPSMLEECGIWYKRV